MEMLEVQIPLKQDGKIAMAVLRIPRIMEAQDYDLMVKAIRWYLDFFKDSLTHDPSHCEAEAEGGPQNSGTA